MRVKYVLAVFSVIWMLLSASVRAENGVAKNEKPVMGEVVVTATRTESAPEQVGGSSFTVITSDDIESRKLLTVPEALRTVPGLDVKSQGGLGASNSVFIRGADSKNTLVLVDGLMYNDPSDPNRGADLASLTMDNIERIEVVRGPMSSLYGSNATAGVVNIITKKGEGTPTFFAGAEGGSYSTWKAFGGGSGELEQFNFSLSASRTETEGFSAANKGNDRIPHAGNTEEDDGWKNTSLSGRFGYAFTEDFDVSATLRHLDSDLEIDDFANAGYAGDRFDFVGFVEVPTPQGPKEAHQESNQALGKIEVHNWFFDRFLDSRFYYQEGNQDRELFDNDNIRTNKWKARNIDAGWQGTFDFSGMNLLTVGYNYFEESFETDSKSEVSADVGSFWANNQFFWEERFVLTASVRSDDHEKFGNKTTWRVAPSYIFAATGTTLKGSYGTGFRAPSLFELFADPIPLFSFNGGNPNVQPETSRGWDAGVEQRIMGEKVTLGATYFQQDYDDRIFYTGNFVSGFTYQNDTGTTRTEGIEAFVRWNPTSDLAMRLDYTHTGAHDPNGDRLTYRPQNKFQFNTRYRCMEKATVNLDVFWVDNRDTEFFDMDKDGNPAGELDAYWLANIAGYYDVTDYLQVYARIDNLLDEFYEVSWSYATPGRSAYIGTKLTY